MYGKIMLYIGIFIIISLMTIGSLLFFYENNIKEFSLNRGAKEKDSPADRISLKDITIGDNFIKIKIDDIRMVKVADTNSMDPVIDKGSDVIETIPRTKNELKKGDIISYYSKEFDTFIIHRIIDIGYDKKGWYVTCKGDNNKVEDPEKIRFWQIKGVVIGIIY